MSIEDVKETMLEVVEPVQDVVVENQLELQKTDLAYREAREAKKAEGVISDNLFSSSESFNLALRFANMLSSSPLVPTQFRGQANLGNVVIALDLANRMNISPMTVMQNIHVIQGKPAFSSSFLIGLFNSCGRYGSIDYEFHGTPGGEDWACRAYAIEKATGEKKVGTWVSMAMANAEGWSTKAGSKWKTMPEQMLRYRAAAFLIRTVAPDLSLGLTREEYQDIQAPPSTAVQLV